jgi:hypothetical protein
MQNHKPNFILYNDPSCDKACIKSTWRSNKPPRSLATQTDDIDYYESSIQTDFSCMDNSYSIQNKSCGNKEV